MRTLHETESAVHIVLLLWSLVENVVSYFITQRVVDIYSLVSFVFF